MFNAKRSTALILSLAFLFVLGFSAPSRADDLGTVAKTFFAKLVNGQSVWSMITKQSQELLIQEIMKEAQSEAGESGADPKEIEAFVRQEMADENSEMSKEAWLEMKKALADEGIPNIKDIKVDGDSALVTLDDESVFKFFKEGGVWKAGLMETVADYTE